MKKLLFCILLSGFILCSCAENKTDIDEAETETSSAEETVSFTVSEGTNGDPSSVDLFAMDTYMNLKAYGDNSSDALTLAAKEIMNLEETLSVTIDGSDISNINSSAGEFVEVSDNTIEILNKAIEVGNKTNGALDVTLYPVLREWGFTTGDYKIPEDSVLDDLLANTGYENIEIDGNSVKIPENYNIDLGSCAKGYAGNSAAEILKENGVESAILNLGGNVQAIGSKPDGSSWKVAIINPFDENYNSCTLSIEDKAVITSGNYERYFTGDDGKNYWHIIDPDTGYPADKGIASVTIVGDNGLDCDALSTAMFVLGTDEAIDYWKENSDDFEMIIITDEKEMYVTEGLESSFELVSDFEVTFIEK